MASSRFVKITDTIVLEYIYYDLNEVLLPSNKWVKSTSNDALSLCYNGNNNSVQFFNGDNSKTINPTTGTANVRDFSYATVNEKSGKYALLDIDKILFYNDFDPLLTATPNLPVTFLNGPYGVTYDLMRIHLSQNFDFEGFDGFVFDLRVKKQDNTYLDLLKFAYNKSDDYIILNPEPFVFSEKIFTSYIDIFVPSLYKLKREYFLNPLTGDTPTERLSNFKGWDRNGFLEFGFGWIEKKERIGSQDYIYVYRKKVAALPDRDPFEVIGTSVLNSTIGDFIEIYPTYNGGNIDTFINDLNSVNGNDYIIIHDIVVSEYIGNGFDNSLSGGSWVITSNQSFSQTDNFDQPIWYRPIIKNSASAIAYKIDYIARFFDRNSNSQFWKRGSLVSFDVRKYGLKLTKIDLGISQPQITLHNKLVENTYSLNLQNNIQNSIQFISNFVSTNSIAASFSTIPTNGAKSSVTSIDELLNNSLGTLNSFDNFGKTYTNGKLKILITDAGNFCRFVIKDYIESSGALRLKDLSSTPDLRLRFYRSDGSFIEITSYELSTDDRTKGEISFYVSPEDAKRIKGFVGRNFNIVNIGNDLSESVLYSGEFLLQNEYIKYVESNEIDSLNSSIEDLKNKNSDLTNSNNTLTTTNKNLNEDNILLRATIDSLKKQLDEAKRKLEEEQLLDEELSKKIINLNEEVKSLTSNKNKEKDVNSILPKNQVKIKGNKALPFKK